MGADMPQRLMSSFVASGQLASSEMLHLKKGTSLNGLVDAEHRHNVLVLHLHCARCGLGSRLCLRDDNADSVACTQMSMSDTSWISACSSPLHVSA